MNIFEIDLDYATKKQLIQYWEDGTIKEGQIVLMMQSRGRLDDDNMPMDDQKITITKSLIDRFRMEIRGNNKK